MYLIKNCQYCGKSFQPLPSSKGMFCSILCSNKGKPKDIHFIEKQKVGHKLFVPANKGVYTTPRESIVCKICGKEFVAVTKLHRIYCSKVCASKDRIHSDETRNKMSKINKNYCKTDVFRENMRNAILKSYKEHPEIKIVLSQKTSEHWNSLSDEGKVNIIRKIRSKSSQRPNKLESKFSRLLNKLSISGYKYTGNNTFYIGWHNPDFVNFDKKIVVELFGDYWHKNDNPQDWIEYYKQFGYSCIIIWENEINSNGISITNNIFLSGGQSEVEGSPMNSRVSDMAPKNTEESD